MLESSAPDSAVLAPLVLVEALHPGAALHVSRVGRSSVTPCRILAVSWQFVRTQPVRCQEGSDVKRPSAPPSAACPRRILGRPRPAGGCQSLRQLVVEHQQRAERTQRSPDSTGHLFVLLFFFLFSFFLRTKLGLFLLFLFAFVFFPLIAHIRFSLLEPPFPQWRLLSNVTEPPDRYCTRPCLQRP